MSQERITLQQNPLDKEVEEYEKNGKSALLKELFEKENEIAEQEEYESCTSTFSSPIKSKESPAKKAIRPSQEKRKEVEIVSIPSKRLSKSVQPDGSLYLTTFQEKMDSFGDQMLAKLSTEQWKKDVKQYKNESTKKRSRDQKPTYINEEAEQSDEEAEEATESESEDDDDRRFQRHVLRKFQKLDHMQDQLEDIKYSVNKILKILSKKH